MDRPGAGRGSNREDQQPIVAFDATPLADPPDYVGGHTLRGIGRYIGNLLSALQTEQSDWAREHLRPVVTRASRRMGGANAIVTRRLGWRRNDLGWLAAWLADRAALNGRTADLWHVLNPNMPLSPLPIHRTVATAYDLIPLHEPAAMKQIRAHRRAIYRLYLRVLRSAQMVIAISHTTAADLSTTLGVDPARIRVAYPPVSVPRPVPTLESDEPPDLLFVGVPDPSKRPELAIETLAACLRRGHDIHLRFAGYQRDADQERLTHLASELGVRDRVEFLGRVADERLNKLYPRSILAATSRIEGFGLPPVESLFSGGKVIAADIPVYREVLEEAADYAAAATGDGFAGAYERAAARRPGPPAELVARYSPRASSEALIAAYREAYENARRRSNS